MMDGNEILKRVPSTRSRVEEAGAIHAVVGGPCMEGYSKAFSVGEW